MKSTWPLCDPRSARQRDAPPLMSARFVLPDPAETNWRRWRPAMRCPPCNEWPEFTAVRESLVSYSTVRTGSDSNQVGVYVGRILWWTQTRRPSGRTVDPGSNSSSTSKPPRRLVSQSTPSPLLARADEVIEWRGTSGLGTFETSRDVNLRSLSRKKPRNSADISFRYRLTQNRLR